MVVIFAATLSGIDLRVGFDLGDRGLTRERGAVAQVSVVNPNYFETMGIPLISGRTFADRDETDGTPVAIINQALARRFFSYRNPIGQRVEPGLAVGTSEPPMREIVGVVGDVRSTNLESSVGLQIYIPEAQLPFSSTMTVVVRTSIDPQSLTRSLERAVHEIDPGAPVYDVKALDQYLSAAVARPRLNTMLLATFGAFALVIGIVGIYGVISYSVAQRTREMGIRIALGAQKGDVLKLVVGHGSKLILTGVGFGIFGAFALTRFLSTMLFVVKPTDPVTFIAVSLILSGVALLASYLPARRATKVDPMVALRYE